MRKTTVVCIAFAMLLSCKTVQHTTTPQPSTDRLSYIERYKELAMQEMRRSGIPASIKMAQAMLESNNGNSTLARQTNNHFGIKCHRDWKGKTYTYDDDRRNECFRKYDNVYDSYRDHTDFLMGSSRYAFLFDYSPTDYKAWARGLKKAGYATHNEYAELLIRIIEENKLYILDTGQEVVAPPVIAATEKEPAETTLTDYPENKAEFTVSLSSRKIYQRNRIDYTFVKKGDTFYSLAKECNMMLWELYRYNDLPRNAIPRVGQIIYLQPKRNTAEPGFDYHQVKDGESMHSISQRYGIKLQQLFKMNLMSVDEEAVAGTILNLRKPKNPEEKEPVNK